MFALGPEEATPGRTRRGGDAPHGGARTREDSPKKAPRIHPWGESVAAAESVTQRLGRTVAGCAASATSFSFVVLGLVGVALRLAFDWGRGVVVHDAHVDFLPSFLAELLTHLLAGHSCALSESSLAALSSAHSQAHTHCTCMHDQSIEGK